MKTPLMVSPTAPRLPVLAAFLCLAPLQNQGQDYTYVTNDACITITGYSGPGGAVAIPGTINGLPVTAIGPWAFLSSTSLTSVNFPSTVTDIGDHAFYSCTALNSLKLPDSLTNISSGAFMECSALADLIIPLSVQSIGATAFACCTALTNVTIPASATSLGRGLFYGCTKLTAIAVDPGNPLYSTAQGILFNKDQTTLVEWPAGKSQNCTIPTGVTSVADFAFYYSPGLTNVDFPDGLTNISMFAFSNCSGLQTVRLPGTLTTMGASAFAYCSSLTGFSIPASVTYIGDGALNNCYNLSAITVEPSNPMYSSLDGVLFDKSQTTLVQYPAAKQGGYAIPSTVRHLGSASFAGCYGLTSVSIPDGVTMIPAWAFDFCGRLATVALPTSLRTIGYLAFRSCGALTSLTLPAAVRDLQNGAFQGCWNLTAVYFTGDSPTSQTYSFDGDQNATIYYLPGTSGWSNTFSGRPAMLWNPKVQTADPAFGPRPAGFGLPIIGTPNIPILLEASTALSDSTWLPLKTCTLSNGSVYLSDPGWSKFTARFYRIRSP